MSNSEMEDKVNENNETDAEKNDGDSSISLSDHDDSDLSQESDIDDDYSALREEALGLVEDYAAGSNPVDSSTNHLDDPLPADFLKRYELLIEPKTMGGIVDLSDSDSEQEMDHDLANEPKCTVPTCSSHKRVKPRSRLVTSYYGLSYIESPVICHRCFVKAAKFYRKVAKIRPTTNRLLMNDSLMKTVDCIDICEDDTAHPVGSKMLENGSVATEFSRNASIHVHNVATKFNIEDKFNRVTSKIESKIGKITVWLNELDCKINMDDQDMVNLLQEVYGTFEPSLKMTEDVDLDIVDADNPEVKKRWDLKTQAAVDKSTIVIDSFSDPDIAIVEDSVEAPSKPSNLPPRGLIVRKKPSVGQKMFVGTSREGESTDWVPAVIESIIINENENKFSYSYKVKIIEDLDPYVKEVSEENMAYFDTSSVRIAVGNRVISAKYDKKMSEPVKYYSGIVAESPSSNNNYRYMVMFDSMAVQYSSHNDIRVTCNMKENLHEYFPAEFRSFIKKYFEMLPTRKILTVNTMDLVKVAYNGRWVDAQVTAVDGLLVEVFYKQGEPTEWLYRGSPRVMSKDMYRARLVKALSSGLLTTQPIPRGGVVADDDPVDVEKVKRLMAGRIGVGVKSAERTVKAVAKKTVTRQPQPQPSHNIHHIYPSRSIYHHKDESAGFVKVIKDLSGMLFPRDLGKHECSEACISWTNTTLDTCRGKNPLVIPMLFAFNRVEATPMGVGARQIYYQSPCGLRLQDFEQLLSYLQATKCPLSVDYFDYDPWVCVWDEFVAAPEGLVLKDLSYGKEFNMIGVVNTVDRDLPPYMNYMVLRKATDGVPLNLELDFLTCCDCTDDCSNKAKCPCWQRTIKDYLDLIIKSDAEMDSNSDVMDYSYIGYQNKRLVEYVASGIYECNSKCKCKHTCLNRVVQLPLKVKLELFKTKFKGWGTRCLNDIPAGGFICVYVGNILTEKAANEGGKTYGDEYFAELDYIEVMERLMNKPGYESGPSDPENTDDEETEKESGGDIVMAGNMRLRNRRKDKEKATRLKRSTTDQGPLHMGKEVKEMVPGPSMSVDPSEPTHQPQPVKQENQQPMNTYIPLRNLYGNNESVYIIDAKTAGNIGRYFNHSCEPNIFVQNVFVDTHDLRFPWVAFFAKHYIRAGTELTWDYQYIVDSVPGKKLFCYCGSKNCRGRLL